MSPTDFRLSSGARNSAAWMELKTHMEQRLERARAKNDAPLPADETAMLRGEIKVLKALLGLEREVPPIPTAPDYGPL